MALTSGHRRWVRQRTASDSDYAIFLLFTIESHADDGGNQCAHFMTFDGSLATMGGFFCSLQSNLLCLSKTLNPLQPVRLE
jgi:hypothetical protein